MLLKGKTQKGKNRIRELGSRWTLLRTEPSVLFSSEPGPWWLVAPAGGPEEKSRWVHPERDRDFQVLADPS